MKNDVAKEMVQVVATAKAFAKALMALAVALATFTGQLVRAAKPVGQAIDMLVHLIMLVGSTMILVTMTWAISTNQPDASVTTLCYLSLAVVIANMIVAGRFIELAKTEAKVKA